MANATPRPPSVLVVDDSEPSRIYAERALCEGGYGVTTASSGPEALSIAQEKGPFDLFVLDVMMPGMRGDELAECLREQDPDVKVVYFTGYSDVLFQGREMLSQNEAFVDKPVTLVGLLEAVSLMLFGHTRGAEARH